MVEKESFICSNAFNWIFVAKKKSEGNFLFPSQQESVLDLKLKEMTEEGKTENLEMVFYNIPPDSVRKMETARRELEEAILKYETIIEQLEDMWDTKVLGDKDCTILTWDYI